MLVLGVIYKKESKLDKNFNFSTGGLFNTVQNEQCKHNRNWKLDEIGFGVP